MSEYVVSRKTTPDLLTEAETIAVDDYFLMGRGETVVRAPTSALSSAIDGAASMEFRWLDYIATAQLAHIANHDLASQDADLVTAGIQEMMQAAMDFVSAEPTERQALIRCRGLFAVNDEIFPETFAEDLWTLTGVSANRFIFDFTGATFQAKDWPSHKAVRTSGFYGEQSITDAVPMVMFRWEQKTKQSWGPIITGGCLVGEEAVTDPIAMKLRNVNLGFYDGLEIHAFKNVGQWIDDINNSDFHSTVISRTGLQPTQAGGNGFLSSTVRFSTVAGSGETTITATESVFDAQHVGKWFMVGGAGEAGTTASGVITDVNSATEAVVSSEFTTDVTGEFGSFVMIEGGISADSATLTLTTDCSIDLVGRYVMVYKAGSKIHTDEDVLVTRVTAQSGSGGRTLTLATQARNTVSDTPVILAPSSFMGKCDDQVQEDGTTAESGHNNDCQFFGHRNEFSFDSVWGGAVASVEQYVLATQFFGRKLHGTVPDYNNFGGNGVNRIADNCKYAADFGSQFEHGAWHPDMGMMTICGGRNAILLQGVNFGGLEVMDRTAYFFMDPDAGGHEDCRLLVSGFFNTPQASVIGSMNRYGTNGELRQISACGPLVSRGADGYPDMPTMTGKTLELWADAPNIIFRDLNASVRGQFDMNNGGIRYRADLNNDGVFDTPVWEMLDVSGTLKMRIAGTQVLTEQQAAIADDASGAANQAKVNAILAALRAHGLIAT